MESIFTLLRPPAYSKSLSTLASALEECMACTCMQSRCAPQTRSREGQASLRWPLSSACRAPVQFLFSAMSFNRAAAGIGSGRSLTWTTPDRIKALLKSESESDEEKSEEDTAAASARAPAKENVTTDGHQNNTPSRRKSPASAFASINITRWPEDMSPLVELRRAGESATRKRTSGAQREVWEALHEMQLESRTCPEKAAVSKPTAIQPPRWPEEKYPLAEAQRTQRAGSARRGSSSSKRTVWESLHEHQLSSRASPHATRGPPMIERPRWPEDKHPLASVYDEEQARDTARRTSSPSRRNVWESLHETPLKRH